MQLAKLTAAFRISNAATLTSALALSALVAIAVIPGGPAFGQSDNAGNGGSGAGQGEPGGNPDAGGAGGPPDQVGGEEEDSDGRGPQANQPEETGGGRPVWAQEGIPAVELGRLSVVRSPEHVLEAAYDEALANFSSEMVDFYSLSIEDAVTELSLNWDSLTILDSPLQNLALLDDALDGSSVLTTMGVENDTNTLAAIFLGVASDKTVPITTDTVIAVTRILGYDLTEAEAEALAADAEAIRIAVLAGHG